MQAGEDSPKCRRDTPCPAIPTADSPGYTIPACRGQRIRFVIRASSFIRHWVFRHSSFPAGVRPTHFQHAGGNASGSSFVLRHSFVIGYFVIRHSLRVSGLHNSSMPGAAHPIRHSCFVIHSSLGISSFVMSFPRVSGLPISSRIRFTVRQPDAVEDPRLTPTSHQLVRRLLLIAAVLAVPVVPFLFFGDTLETRITEWLDAELSPGTVAWAVIGLLASDILLPVPSSVVSTFAGRMLGFWVGAGASWCGMTLGAAIAFWLVRVFGRPLAARLSSDQELARTDDLASRWGVFVLVLARPIPVLAEASVLLMGTTRLAWWQFLIAVGLSNLGIAAAYAALGNRVQLPVAIAASIALPMLAAALARWLFRADGKVRPTDGKAVPRIKTSQERAIRGTALPSAGDLLKSCSRYLRRLRGQPGGERCRQTPTRRPSPGTRSPRRVAGTGQAAPGQAQEVGQESSHVAVIRFPAPLERSLAGAEAQLFRKSRASLVAAARPR